MIYEYKCPHCGAVAELQRRVADRDDKVVCSCQGKDDDGFYKSVMERVVVQKFTTNGFLDHQVT